MMRMAVRSCSRTLARRSPAATLSRRGMAVLSAPRVASLLARRVKQPLVSVPVLRAVQATRFYSSDLPEHIVVAFPSLSPTMTTGTLQNWNVKVGDEVAAGDSLADVETDKATMSFDSSEDGIVAKLLIEDGTSDIAIGQPVCVLVEDEADVAAFENYQPEATPAAEAPAAEPKKEEAPKSDDVPAPSTTTSTSAPAQPASSASGDRIFASPLAKRLAQQASIALSDLKGTGPQGRITKADVEAYEPTSAPAPAASATPSASAGDVEGSYEDIPLTNMRKVIAQRLQESKQQVPHYYLTAEVKMDNVMALRKQFHEQGNGDYKLSMNDFVIKASAAALNEVKECNSAWMDTFIREHDNVDISVAVSTDAGLITPIVFDADLKGLREISSDVKDLATRARDNKLKPEEFQGGTFTISNLGMFGVKSFSAIINPPQACILAVGGTEQQVVVDPTTESGFATANVMSVTLSCDHRVVDGAVGAQWLKSFKKYMEEPVSMLL